ncbi:MAG: dTDP-4-dehydrorhamnose reductase [Dehalococcoidia bacterium]|nr:dTDP-4-dehydrorhamnose reductase [Dehalococcoidia bacterium]
MGHGKRGAGAPLVRARTRALARADRHTRAGGRARPARLGREATPVANAGRGAVKVLLLGAAGQLGQDIRRRWTGHEITTLAHADCDVRDRDQVLAATQRHMPDLVMDNAAYVRVDDAEREPLEAFAVNAEGARHAAEAAVECGASILYVSTDYVFGRGDQPHQEDEAVHPQGAYALTKAAGEALIRETTPRHFVVRSSGLYGVAGSSGKGGNFVETMLRFGREGRAWKVVADQVLTPTYTADLADKLEELVSSGAYGTYHLTNAGECSWLEFARAALDIAGIEADVSPTTTEEWGAPAPRPAYSVLANSKLGVLGIEPMRHWRDALRVYLVEKGHASAR